MQTVTVSVQGVKCNTLGGPPTRRYKYKSMKWVRWSKNKRWVKVFRVIGVIGSIGKLCIIQAVGKSLKYDGCCSSQASVCGNFLVTLDEVMEKSFYEDVQYLEMLTSEA